MADCSTLLAIVLHCRVRKNSGGLLRVLASFPLLRELPCDSPRQHGIDPAGLRLPLAQRLSGSDKGVLHTINRNALILGQYA